MSVTYRYKCATENALVWETRTLAQGPPTVCVNEGGSIVTGTLTILDAPTDLDDLIVTSTVDFSGATIFNLSHTSLTNIGTYSHADIDTHIEDVTQHRVIDDMGTGATDLWSAAKIITSLATKADTEHTHVVADVTDFATAVDDRADARIEAQKGASNGLATLDINGKIPASQLELGSVVYEGTWNANTNSPTLASGVGDKGSYYVVSTAGATDLDGVTDWTMGDWAIFNGTAWEKADHTDQVSSVAGKTGAVTLIDSDITNFSAAVSANVDVAASVSHASDTNNPHAVTIDQVTIASAKGDLLAHTGSATVVRSVGSNGQILQADSTQVSGLKWASNKKFIVSSRNGVKTKAEVYTRVDHFIYPGSTITASNVTRVLVNAQAESGVMYDVRLYDVSNGNEIAKVTGLTNETPGILSLGTVSNVPSSDAMFEIHIIRTAGSDPNGIVYYSTMLEY